MTQRAKDSLDAVIKEAFEENVAQMPPEDRPFVGPEDGYCLVEDDGYKCTKAKGHAGQHCAHGSFGYVLRRW